MFFFFLFFLFFLFFFVFFYPPLCLLLLSHHFCLNLQDGDGKTSFKRMARAKRGQAEGEKLSQRYNQWFALDGNGFQRPIVTRPVQQIRNLPFPRKRSSAHLLNTGEAIPNHMKASGMAFVPYVVIAAGISVNSRRSVHYGRVAVGNCNINGQES